MWRVGFRAPRIGEQASGAYAGISPDEEGHHSPGRWRSLRTACTGRKAFCAWLSLTTRCVVERQRPAAVDGPPLPDLRPLLHERGGSGLTWGAMGRQHLKYRCRRFWRRHAALPAAERQLQTSPCDPATPPLAIESHGLHESAPHEQLTLCCRRQQWRQSLAAPAALRCYLAASAARCPPPWLLCSLLPFR